MHFWSYEAYKEVAKIITLLHFLETFCAPDCQTQWSVSASSSPRRKPARGKCSSDVGECRSCVRQSGCRVRTPAVPLQRAGSRGGGWLSDLHRFHGPRYNFVFGEHFLGNEFYHLRIEILMTNLKYQGIPCHHVLYNLLLVEPSLNSYFDLKN